MTYQNNHKKLLNKPRVKNYVTTFLIGLKIGISVECPLAWETDLASGPWLARAGPVRILTAQF